MAWCLILWKAIKVRRAYNRLKRAKLNSYREAIGLPPIYPLYERPFRWIWSKLKALFFNTCCICCKPRPGRPSFCSRLCAKGTLPNEIAKAIIGCVVGFIFSKLMLDFMTTNLNFHAVILYWTCFSFGVILTVGMTFSDTVRCLFILGVPQLFNSKGRVALLSYLFVLALSGPGKNTAMNMEVLTESLVCGQNMVKESTQELVDLATAPWSALKKAVTIIIESLDGVVGRMRKELSGVVDTIYEIINVIKKAYALLKNIANMCNSKLGTPFDRCMTAFEDASKDCTREMGSAFDWMCSPLDLFRHFCHFAKIPNLVFCWIPSLIKEHIFEPLKEHFKNFANSFSKFFDLKPLNVSYSFGHSLTQDKTLREIASNMKAEIMGHVQWFLDCVDLMDLAISGFLFLVIWKAFSYRYKYLNSDEFDNYYISRELVRIDLRRKKLNRASIFPLRYRESKIYVQTFSWALVKEERLQMRLAILLVSIAAVQICNYILMDYLLYSFLELIREYGSIQVDTAEALGFVFTIEGEGFLAEMYRTILRGLSPIGGILPSFDTSKCLPVAHPPNYWQYALILSLLALTFIIAALEPYGLRMRHIICGWIYEKRIIQRETWLYQHILSTRDNFLEFAASQIKARLKGDKSIYQVSIMDRLAHMVPFCNRLFKTHTKKCFLCGQPGELEDFEYFVECPSCHTVYCKECFSDMGQKCLACMKKINYEELSDFSEEFDSDGDSDEDRDLIEICCSRLCRCSTCGKKSKSKTRSKKRETSSKKIVSKSKSKKTTGKNQRQRPKTSERYKDVKYQKLENPKPRPKTPHPPRRRKRELSSKPVSKKSPQKMSSPRKRVKRDLSITSKSRPKSPPRNPQPKSKSKSNRKSKTSRSKSRTKSKTFTKKTSPKVKSKKSVKKSKSISKKTRKVSKRKGTGKSAIIASGIGGLLKESGSRSRSKSKGSGSKGGQKPRARSKNKVSKKRVERSPRSKSRTSKRKQSKSKSRNPRQKRSGRSKSPLKGNRGRSSSRKSKKVSKSQNRSSKRKRRSPRSPRSVKKPAPRSRKQEGKSRKSRSHANSKTRKRRANSLSPVRKSGRSTKKRAVSEPKSKSRRPTLREHSGSRKKVTKTRNVKHKNGTSRSKSPSNRSKRNASHRRSKVNFQEDSPPSRPKRKSRSRSRSGSPERRTNKHMQIHEHSHETETHHQHHQDDDDEGLGSGSRSDSGSSSSDSCQRCRLERSWWNRDPRTLEPFRQPPKRVAPALQERVDYLNDFYENMPYPPHCNL